MDLSQYNTKQLHILEYAAKEFLIQGYVAASTNTIAKDAKVAKGLIFHYFKNKETLYKNVLELSYHYVEEIIDSKMLTLSTYMDAFILIKDLILIKESLIYDDPLHAPILTNAFNIDTEIPETLAQFILDMKERFALIFSSFLDGLFLQDKLRTPFKSDEKIFYRIMILFEAAFKYEKEQRILNNTFTTLEDISLDYYEKMIKKGIVL